MDSLTNLPFLPKNKLGHMFIFWLTEVFLLLATYQIFRASGHGAVLSTMQVNWTNLVRFALSDDLVFFVILYVVIQFVIQNITESIPLMVGKAVAAKTTEERLNLWALQRGILTYDESSKTYIQGKGFDKYMEGSSKKEVKRYKQNKRDVTKVGVLLLAVTAVLIAKPFGWLKWTLIFSILNGVLCLIGIFYIAIQERKDKSLYKRLRQFPPPLPSSITTANP